MEDKKTQQPAPAEKPVGNAASNMENLPLGNQIGQPLQEAIERERKKSEDLYKFLQEVEFKGTLPDERPDHGKNPPPEQK